MGIYKNINPEDVSLRSFEVHKEFTFTNNDSGSGVYGIGQHFMNHQYISQ
jgi:hypothetical protein